MTHGGSRGGNSVQGGVGRKWEAGHTGLLARCRSSILTRVDVILQVLLRMGSYSNQA